METANPNREFKDSVFTALFGTPEKALELYNAINGSNYSDSTKVKIVTLPKALYGKQLNDVAFVIENKLVVLIEHQSTINKNIPLRMLLYIGREYELLTDRRDRYKSERISIPAPEFVVLYNGEKEMEDFVEMRLSDLFAFDVNDPKYAPCLELVVKAYNINKGRNAEFAARSSSLSDYEEFIAEVREKLKAMGLSEAVKAAIRSCISRNILVDFLTVHASEIENMLLSEWNMETALEVRFEEGKTEGRTEGKTEGRTEVLDLLAKGYTFEQIKETLRVNCQPAP